MRWLCRIHILRSIHPHYSLHYPNQFSLKSDEVSSGFEQRLDSNSKTIVIAAAGDNLYQLHRDGWIWKYTGDSSWQRLDNSSKTIAIAAAGDNLYQLHRDGLIWQYTGTPCSGDSCPGWQLLDSNSKTIAISNGNGTVA